jgi:hypothetical protein
MSKLFPLAVFAGVFAAVYYACFVFGYTPYRYYPLNGEISAVDLPRTAGPAMGWFTWIVVGSLAGLIAAAVAYVVPKSTSEKAGAVMSWAIPLAVTIWILYVEKHWFFPAEAAQ